jgi:hypothetical protein
MRQHAKIGYSLAIPASFLDYTHSNILYIRIPWGGGEGGSEQR